MARQQDGLQGENKTEDLSLALGGQRSHGILAQGETLGWVPAYFRRLKACCIVHRSKPESWNKSFPISEGRIGRAYAAGFQPAVSP